MGKYILILLSSVLISSEFPKQYYTSMDKALELFNSAQNEEDYLQASNFFYRISNAVKTDWLSSYYYALSNVMISFIKQDIDDDIKEIYLDKALEIIIPYDTISIVDSLAYSEINTLKAMVYGARISTMSSAMKYSPLLENSLNIALKFYSKNPRTYFVNGQSAYIKPSFVGGGANAALPLLEKSLNYYNEFEAKPYWPNWGKEDCKKLYDKALSEKK